MSEISLKLTIEEVNFILHNLGDLPVRTNAMFLIQKIKDQAHPQLTQEESKDAGDADNN